EMQADSQREHRIEHCTCRARESTVLVKRAWRPRRTATPDEARAIGLAGHRTDLLRARCDHVRAPALALVRRAGPATGHDRGALGNPLRFHEQTLKGRMR